MAGATLVWQEWRIDGTSGPELSGTAIELGNAVQRTSPPAGNLDEAVDALDEGARRAGSRLYSSHVVLEGLVSKIFGADPGDEAANVAALVVINAMVFQDRLASNEVAFQPVSAAMQEGRFPRMTLLQVWAPLDATTWLGGSSTGLYRRGSCWLHSIRASPRLLFLRNLLCLRTDGPRLIGATPRESPNCASLIQPAGPGPYSWLRTCR